MDCFRHEILHHPDSKFQTFLLKGLTEGFHPKLQSFPSTNLECTNNLSARLEPSIVTDLVHHEVQCGYVIGPYASPPFSAYRISPLGVATGKYSRKKRLILDLSAPHNNIAPSINDLIDKDECSMSYVSIDQAISRIILLGPGAQMCKVDITDAFKQTPLHPASWPFFGFHWRSNYYF